MQILEFVRRRIWTALPEPLMFFEVFNRFQSDSEGAILRGAPSDKYKQHQHHSERELLRVLDSYIYIYFCFSCFWIYDIYLSIYVYMYIRWVFTACMRSLVNDATSKLRAHWKAVVVNDLWATHTSTVSGILGLYGNIDPSAAAVFSSRPLDPGVEGYWKVIELGRRWCLGAPSGLNRSDAGSVMVHIMTR